jgi:DNA-binding transcriptional LysR family regulator
MNDKQIRSFLRIVEVGSFSRAAQELYVSPQALVQQINCLEEEIGTRLLQRSPKGIVCTLAGDYFYKNIKYLVTSLEQMKAECRRIGNQVKETLRVGVFSTPLYIPTFCFTFSMNHPEIEVKQVEIDSENFFKLLLVDELDAAECGPFSILPEKDLVFTKLMDLQPVCVFSKNHPLAGKSIIEPEDLAGQTVGVPDINFFISSQKSSRAMGQIHFVDKVFGRESMAKICLGGGTYIIPEPAALALRPYVAVPFHSELLEIGIVTRREPSSTVRLFIEEALNAYKS